MREPHERHAHEILATNTPASSQSMCTRHRDHNWFLCDLHAAESRRFLQGRKDECQVQLAAADPIEMRSGCLTRG